ncbi:hypothetical protein [Paraburkholderia sp. CNPSo 3272]|nr:hypothetical protein [Paraburkholderia sp. CNPSo 3272]
MLAMDHGQHALHDVVDSGDCRLRRFAAKARIADEAGALPA